MTIAEILRQISGRTTDAGGYVASYTVREGQNVVACVDASLDNSSRTVTDWRVKWTAHYRDGAEIKSETSTNLTKLLARFGAVDLTPMSQTKPEEFFAKQSG